MNALPEHTNMWDYVTTLFIEAGKRMSQRKMVEQSNMSGNVCVVAAFRYNRDETQFSPPARVNQGQNVICFNCDRYGYVVRDCRELRRRRPDNDWQSRNQSQTLKASSNKK